VESTRDSLGWSGDDPRRNKYVIDNPNTVWDCWPEESIKAQVLAARSYGVTSSQPICRSASCQVYKGGKAKAWAAWETQNLYIVSNGGTHANQIIRAFYSSYNSNGWGTADHETIWPDSRAGGKSHPYTYLRSVKDSDFTYRYISRYSWRSSSYSIDELNL
jgi:SpoIID/LytB domain protein